MLWVAPQQSSHCIILWFLDESARCAVDPRTTDHTIIHQHWDINKRKGCSMLICIDFCAGMLSSASTPTLQQGHRSWSATDHMELGGTEPGGRGCCHLTAHKTVCTLVKSSISALRRGLKCHQSYVVVTRHCENKWKAFTLVSMQLKRHDAPHRNSSHACLNSIKWLKNFY